MLADWLALVFLLVALLGSAAWAAVRGLHAWRTFHSFSRRTTAALDGVTRTAAAAEQHAVALSEGAERLAASTTHLQGSLAQLAVIRAAAVEARATLDVRRAVPRK